MTNPVVAGISEQNRARLEQLHRRLRGPFSVSDASAVWALDMPRSRRLVAYLASRGWLSRIRRDAYTTVPLGAASPGDWREDPWVVAATVFSPCYIGGWSACEHWDLTEQIFREIVVITTRPIRQRQGEIQGTLFRVKRVNPRKMFGLVSVWRGQERVQVSDQARTLVDILDDPAMGGGVRHVSDVLLAYFDDPIRDDDLVADYADRFGNRTVFKRLGYLLETLGISAPKLVATCMRRMSTGLSLLDPAAPPAGPVVARWGLRVNVSVERQAG